MTKLNLTAVKLYFKDEKNKRTLDIITDLLEPDPNQAAIARKYGVSRQTVIDIKNKYVNL